MATIPQVSGYGGPSVLSDGVCVYTATVVERDGLDGVMDDVRFSMVDTTTFEEVVMYRKDYEEFLFEEGDELTWQNPLPMALYGQGIIYFFELYKKYYYGRYFTITKIDFNLQEMTRVHLEILPTFGTDFFGYTTLFTIYIDQNNNTPYLVWDVPIYKTQAINIYGHAVGIAYDSRLEQIGPCMTDIDYCTYTHYTNLLLRSGSEQIVSSVELFVYNLEADSLSSTFTLWDNNYINDNDSITSVSCVPTPIVYNNIMYLCYNVTNRGRVFCKSATKLDESWPYTGLYAPVYITCNTCSVFSDAQATELHYELWHLNSSFSGNLFFLLFAVDPLAEIVIKEEFANGRSVTMTHPNWSFLPRWNAECPAGVDCESPGYPDDCDEWGFYKEGILGGELAEAIAPSIQDNYVFFNNITPLKMVFDYTNRFIYLRVQNPDPKVTTCNYLEDPNSNNVQYTYGLYKINIDDFLDYKLVVTDRSKDIFDIFMSEELAYLVYVDDEYGMLIYKLMDMSFVVDVSPHYSPYVPGYFWEDTTLGTKLTQQPSTDEHRIWKLYPSIAGDTFYLTGYSLIGETERILEITAPFLFSRLDWFNIYQHDGKIILTTGEDVSGTPLVGIWLIT